METRRYTFKLYPNRTQDRALHVQRRLCGDVWNAAIQQREEAYRRQGKSLSNYDQAREIKHLRPECPEFMAVSASTLSLVLKSVQLSYQAFFRKLKEGKSYQEAGHPRFRHPDRHPSIPHREGKWGMERVGKNWRVRVYGVEGKITARGRFPFTPDDKKQLRSAELLWRDGSWWLSVVVKMPTRRTAGAGKATVRLDLIDEFARVERENGEMSVPRGCVRREKGEAEAQITESNQGVDSASGVEAGDLGGDDRRPSDSETVQPGVEAGDLGGDDRDQVSDDGVGLGVEAGDLLGTALRSAMQMQGKADAIKAERDTRFKRGSRRWKEWTRRAKLHSGRAARARREALHRWSTDLVAGAGDLTVVRPDVLRATKSAKGTETDHGAAVDLVAEVNRHILGQAPALAVQMIEYKAAEAGVRCDVIADPAPVAETGQAISLATKEVKRLRRKTRKRAMPARAMEAAE